MKDFCDIVSETGRAVRLLQERYQSEEYRQNCQRFIAERDRLLKITERFMSNLDQLKCEFEAAVVRTEHASGCKYLHRGYYCPSMIQDIVVGNVRRGKLLKRLTARTKTCWEYGFNAEGKLILCESLVSQTVADESCLIAATREFLFYEDDCVYGITIRSDGSVEAITEEVYQDGKCISYIHALCTSFGGIIKSHEISSEHYTYEGEKMHAQWHRLMIPPQNTLEFAEAIGLNLPSIPIYQKDQYHFEKKDGRLILAENT